MELKHARKAEKSQEDRQIDLAVSRMVGALTSPDKSVQDKGLAVLSEVKTDRRIINSVFIAIFKRWKACRKDRDRIQPVLTLMASLTVACEMRR